jgi:hypothetical protein
MNSSEAQKIRNYRPRPISGTTPLPYRATPGSEMVDGNRMDARKWILGDELVMLNAIPCRRLVDFYADVPEGLRFSHDDRERLILVEKEFLRRLRIERLSSWGYLNQTTRSHFRALVRFMAKRGHSCLRDLTPEAVLDFLVYPKKTGPGRIQQRRFFMCQIYEQFLRGNLPDGLCFDPADHESDAPETEGSIDENPGQPRPGRLNRGADHSRFGSPRNLTMPLDEGLFLRILAGASDFIRTIKGDLLEAVHEFAETGEADMERFRGLPCLQNIWKLELECLLREFQRACYIVISSTLIGRSNEYVEIERYAKCYVPTLVNGETSHGVMIPWSKRRDQKRILTRGRGTPLTVEAIKALDEIVAAHPGTRNSKYLFCRFSGELYGSGPVGALLTAGTMTHGIRKFLDRIVGLSKDEVTEVHPHRFRSTAIVNLCCVENGVIAAWIEARHASLNELCNYALAATNWLGIEQALDKMAA